MQDTSRKMYMGQGTGKAGCLNQVKSCLCLSSFIKLGPFQDKSFLLGKYPKGSLKPCFFLEWIKNQSLIIVHLTEALYSIVHIFSITYMTGRGLISPSNSLTRPKDVTCPRSIQISSQVNNTKKQTRWQSHLIAALPPVSPRDLRVVALSQASPTT